jgi:hypothetical protein
MNCITIIQEPESLNICIKKLSAPIGRYITLPIDIFNKYNTFEDTIKYAEAAMKMWNIKYGPLYRPVGAYIESFLMPMETGVLKITFRVDRNRDTFFCPNTGRWFQHNKQASQAKKYFINQIVSAI